MPAPHTSVTLSGRKVATASRAPNVNVIETLDFKAGHFDAAAA